MHRRGQGREGQLGAAQRGLFGRHVAVAKLIGQHEVRLGPHRDQRLIAAAAFRVRQGGLLVTLDEGAVEIDGGDPLGLALPGVKRGDVAPRAGQHVLQSLAGFAQGQDEALLLGAGRPEVGKSFIVEAVEEGADGGGLGRGVAQTALAAFIARAQGDGLGMIAADGLEEEEGLDQLGLGEPALAGLEGEVGGDEVGEFEGAEGAGSGEEAGVGAAHFAEGRGVESEGSLVEDGEACGRGYL